MSKGLRTYPSGSLRAVIERRLRNNTKGLGYWSAVAAYGKLYGKAPEVGAAMSLLAGGVNHDNGNSQDQWPDDLHAVGKELRAALEEPRQAHAGIPNRRRPGNTAQSQKRGGAPRHKAAAHAKGGR